MFQPTISESISSEPYGRRKIRHQKTRHPIRISVEVYFIRNVFLSKCTPRPETYFGQGRHLVMGSVCNANLENVNNWPVVINTPMRRYNIILYIQVFFFEVFVYQPPRTTPSQINHLSLIYGTYFHALKPAISVNLNFKIIIGYFVSMMFNFGIKLYFITYTLFAFFFFFSNNSEIALADCFISF